jgi:hypothetical protein
VNLQHELRQTKLALGRVEQRAKELETSLDMLHQRMANMQALQLNLEKATEQSLTALIQQVK